jgi:hypothetical protein
LSVAIVVKSAGKESGVSFEKSDVPDGVVVEELDAGFDELPHAESAKAAAAAVATRATRFFLERTLLVDPVGRIFTSVSFIQSRRRRGIHTRVAAAICARVTSIGTVHPRPERAKNACKAPCRYTARTARLPRREEPR